jgi:hypothetical protein
MNMFPRDRAKAASLEMSLGRLALDNEMGDPKEKEIFQEQTQSFGTFWNPFCSLG